MALKDTRAWLKSLADQENWAAMEALADFDVLTRKLRDTQASLEFQWRESDRLMKLLEKK